MTVQVPHRQFAAPLLLIGDAVSGMGRPGGVCTHPRWWWCKGAWMQHPCPHPSAPKTPSSHVWAGIIAMVGLELGYKDPEDRREVGKGRKEVSDSLGKGTGHLMMCFWMVKRSGGSREPRHGAVSPCSRAGSGSSVGMGYHTGISSGTSGFYPHPSPPHCCDPANITTLACAP